MCVHFNCSKFKEMIESHVDLFSFRNRTRNASYWYVIDPFANDSSSLTNESGSRELFAFASSVFSHFNELSCLIRIQSANSLGDNLMKIESKFQKIRKNLPPQFKTGIDDTKTSQIQ